jgi:hypothetical protein
MRAITLSLRFSILVLVATTKLPAQTSAAAVTQALRVMTAGFGGCFEKPVEESARLEFFAPVAFTRGTCEREHGDTISRIVGVDRGGVLHLLSSRDAFNFLVARNPPPPLDSTNVVRYALIALEMSGYGGVGALLERIEDVPRAALDSVRRYNPPLTWINSRPNGRVWQVHFVTVAKGGYYRPSVARHELVLMGDGELVSVRTTLLWSDPNYP